MTQVDASSSNACNADFAFINLSTSSVAMLSLV